jgi:putative Holliday junction resolvase
VQQKETINYQEIAEPASKLNGRILALDPGTKRIGVAVCDELQITTRALPFVPRSSWKKLLNTVKGILLEFDAAALVIGLPLNSDGSESGMSAEARRLARNFGLSLDVPVFLQDERVTSYEAKGRLWKSGIGANESRGMVDSEAAAIILADFLDRTKQAE